MYIHPKADDSWDKIYLYVEKTARVNREVILFDKPEELEHILITLASALVYKDFMQSEEAVERAVKEYLKHLGL